ncbi:MAG: sugar ABC transporter substrate-binding protein [Acidobacteria bacterium]|nr:sugar ABC transporter substrate-binding protein [Acidobacteriota bacterium]MCW5969095.1 sugar ABC transporter substrate-binding protein [Blastocatellales bacterium]
MMKRWVAAVLLSLGLLSGCNQNSGPKRITIGVSFETLQTEYWVAGFEAIKAELKKRDIAVLEAIADGDANRQLEQVNNFIARGVDGIIAVPKDAKTIIPMIKAANAADIPIVLYNRPAGKTDAKSVAVVADNPGITKATVQYMCEQAKKSGKKHKALLLMGDLGDINAVGRRDGFESAVKEYSDIIEVVARVPTEWNQEKALAGVTNALQAHPDINFIFTSSDFLFPSIVAALKNADRYKRIGEEGHVLLGGFDGDPTAYQMLKDGYLDADGVQNVYFESEAAVQAVLDLKAGKSVPEVIRDPGFVIHQGNLNEMSPQMWGAQVKNAQAGK